MLLRALSSATIVVATVAAVGSARADGPDTPACIEAHLQAQKARRTLSLRSAEQQLLVCAQPACPAVIQRECARWLEGIAEEMPSLLPVVRSEAGDDLTAYTLEVDGVTVPSGAGKPLELDPGRHDLRVSQPGYLPVEHRVELRVGERLRRVLFTLPPARTESSAPARRRGAVAPVALGAVSLAGLAAYAVFGLRARDGEHALRACAPGCSQRAVDDVRRDYVAANIAVAVGAGAGLGATLLLLFAPRAAASPARARSRAPRLELTPVRGGAATTFRAAF